MADNETGAGRRSERGRSRRFGMRGVRRFDLLGARGTAAALLLLLASARQLVAQGADTALGLTTIFGGTELDGAPLPAPQWLPDGNSWIETHPAPGGGTDIIRVSAERGDTTVVARASDLVGDDGKPMTIEGLTLSRDGTKALLFHNSVRVWRQNTRGVYHVLDLATRRLMPLSRTAGLQMFAKFSPDGRRAAFVRDNNLFVADLIAGGERALTSDGSDVIVNGTSDWVYEEELGVRDAFRWSPDSRRIAFWRFDQTAIPIFPMVDQLPTSPKVLPLRYPKAGDPNSRVRVGVVDVGSGGTTWMNTGADTLYIASVEWESADSLTIQRLNRVQNEMTLLLASASTGATRTLLSERSDAWVSVDDATPRWVERGKMFIWPSEQGGWRHYALYRRDGSLAGRLSRDSVDATALAAVDEAHGLAYVMEAAPRPMERQVMAYPLKVAGKPKRVTTEAGTHRIDVSPNGRWMVDRHSTASMPPTVTLVELQSPGRRRVLQGNDALRTRLAASTRAPEFFQLPMPDGVKLNAWRILPPAFDSTRRYPVLMYVYGGPGSQTVLDDYMGKRFLWHQYLAHRGYVVVSVDNRGTGARGADFMHSVYLNLGARESQDQIDAARWLRQQRWVDSSRVAIWGWSYGGYMAALTSFKGGPLFRAAISVAPVTDWHLYDDIYTERYMRTPAENPTGYKVSAPQAHVAGLTAQYLLVHGTGDDNVHPQNTIQLADKLQAAGKQFELMLYPDRTHSISGGNTQLHLFTLLTNFLDRAMGTPGAEGDMVTRSTTVQP